MESWMNITLKSTFLFLSLFFLVGCSTKRLDKTLQYPALPKQFNQTTQSIPLNEKWLENLQDNNLVQFIQKALNNNHELKQHYFDIKIKEQELIASKSFLFPTLDLNASSSKDGNFEGVENPSSSKLSLELQYTIDLWGKLSDSSKAANMNLLQSKALYEEAKQQLISEVSLLYFQIVEANNLLALYEKNLQNSQHSYSLTLSRYKQGISEALDTLLAKNSIYTQESKITSLKTTKAQTIYQLEQLLGDYPKGKLDIKKPLPVVNLNITTGIPSDIIEKKPSITASWHALLAKDYKLAFTHKQRLPSLSLSGSIEDTRNNAAPLAWSLLAGLTTPIFSAGELKANENIAYFELKKAELEYLNTLFSAYVDIESYLSEEKNLKEEYIILKQAHSNAQHALQLSFNQYLKGIIEYPTVLDLQETLYSTQESLIKMQYSLIRNRINIHQALGGDFMPLQKVQKESNP